MKGIRRAAAMCLTMTLAVSTLFGNTAWADMPQKTERKKCVHVHTEECYGEPDEEATSSQIGEEPTECTHVCTVESGCIRNTAVSSGTGADDFATGPDDEETNDQKDSADKAENAPSVSTPSDMEDTAVPGGTVIPAVKSQIFSWSWYDPEENLLDGKLELSGVTEEAQPSFEEVTEYLPEAIIAQVGEESEVGGEKERKNFRSLAGPVTSTCRMKKDAGPWKAPMSLQQSCRRHMNWRKMQTHWWWKCL